MTTSQRSILLLFACLTLSAPCVQASTFIDDDFSSPDYLFKFISQPDPADLSTSLFTDFTTGGNPNFYRNIRHEHEVEREMDGSPSNGTGLVTHQSLLLETNDSYLPLMEGAIQTLTYSINVRTSRPADVFFFFENNLGSGFAAGFTSVTNTGGWETISLTFTQADFSMGADFASASPLRFGFGFSSNDNVTAGPTAYSFDVDNFKVDITPVPEPSAALCAVLGGTMLLRSRRRR